MIVVAIIALLAAIAVPSFIRSRKRSQATSCLNDVKVLDNATAQYAIEYSRAGGDTIPQARFLMAYLKPGSRMYSQLQGASMVTDTIGNQFNGTTFDAGIKISSATVNAFTDVIDNSTSFWGAYQ